MYKIKSSYGDYYMADYIHRSCSNNNPICHSTGFGLKEIADAESDTERERIATSLLVKDISETVTLSTDFLMLFSDEVIETKEKLTPYVPIWMLAKRAANFLNQPEHLSDYCSLFGPAAIELATIHHDRASQRFPVCAIDNRLYLGNNGGYIELTGMRGFKRDDDTYYVQLEGINDGTILNARCYFRGEKYEWSVYSDMMYDGDDEEADPDFEPTVPSYKDNPDYNIPDESDLNPC